MVDLSLNRVYATLIIIHFPLPQLIYTLHHLLACLH